METVRIQESVLDAMLAEARRTPAQECCGLLAGREGVITTLLPTTNVLASATHYEIAPEELFRLFKQMRAEDLQHMGIYHSHPRGPNIPSPTDVKRAFYPDAAYFIVSPALHVAQPVRAFQIRGSQFRELMIAQQEPGSRVNQVPGNSREKRS